MRCRPLVLLSALLMLLTGCAQEAPAEPIFAIVEGVEIPVSRVDHTLALDEAAYEFSLRWIEDADFLTEEEKQEPSKVGDEKTVSNSTHFYHD